jgi:hypothetical protein
MHLFTLPKADKLEMLSSFDDYLGGATLVHTC